MTCERPALERRVLSALDAEPSRIPVVLGGCGSGRTSLLTRLTERLADRPSRYVDVERIASTPERFLTALTRNSPSAADDAEASLPTGRQVSRAAFEALLAFLGRRGSTPSVLLLDEWLEVRTLESFPGLRGAVRELVDVLVQSPNRFVLASRFANRTHRALHDFSTRIEFIHLPPLSPQEVATVLRQGSMDHGSATTTELGRLVHALAAGRPRYVETLAASLSSPEGHEAEPVRALAAQMAAGAPLSHACRFSYELRLHRARGYGALKAILDILADTQPLTLTEIARRLGRTPGSTKDYLTWLEDVDLIENREKRYRFADPVLRLWVRLHGRTAAPDDRVRALEAQEYAAARLASGEVPVPPTPRSVPPPRRPRNLIEID